MKRIISLVLCGTLLASLAACSGGSSGGQTSTQQSEAAWKENETAAPAQTGSDKGTVKIGVLLPFTGASAYSAELAREGYDYAVEYYNGQGGIKSLGGAKLEIVYADTTGVTEVGVTEFERLVNVEKIDIASGPYNSAVMGAVAPLAEKYQMPFVVNQASSLNIYTAGYTYVFNPSNDARTNVQGLIGICDMVEELYGDKIDGIGLIMENTEWGLSQKETFEKYFTDAGKKVMINETIEPGATDFSSQISKLKASGVKFVVPCISSYNDAVLFVRQMKEYNCNAGILASGGVFVVPEFAQALGDDANYIFSTDTWNKGFLESKGEKAVKIHDGYVEKYGHDMGENAGMAWIAMSTIVAALEEAGTKDKQTVRDTLYGLNLPADSEYMLLVPFEGMKFDEIDESGCLNHNKYGLSCISQLIDGKWKMVWPNEMLGEHNPLVWPIPE